MPVFTGGREGEGRPNLSGNERYTNCPGRQRSRGVLDPIRRLASRTKEGSWTRTDAWRRGKRRAPGAGPTHSVEEKEGRLAPNRRRASDRFHNTQCRVRNSKIAKTVRRLLRPAPPIGAEPTRRGREASRKERESPGASDIVGGCRRLSSTDFPSFQTGKQR